MTRLNLHFFEMDERMNPENLIKLGMVTSINPKGVLAAVLVEQQLMGESYQLIELTSEDVAHLSGIFELDNDKYIRDLADKLHERFDNNASLFINVKSTIN